MWSGISNEMEENFGEKFLVQIFLDFKEVFGYFQKKWIFSKKIWIFSEKNWIFSGKFGYFQ